MSMTFSPTLLIVGALLAVVLGSTAHAYERPITLIESLGHPWAEDLVHRRLEFPAGQLFSGKLELLRDGTVVICQLDAVTLHPDGSIKSADVWFRSDLPANATRSFTLRSRADAAPAAQTDLAIERVGNILELRNGVTAVRLPAGEWALPPNAQPAALATYLNVTVGGALPGPILGVKLANGTWSGPSLLKTKDTFVFERIPGLPQAVDPKEPAGNFTAYTTEVLAQGPLFLRARTTFTFVGGGRYVVTVTLRSGEPLARIDESYVNAGSVTFPFGAAVRPTTAYYEANATSEKGKSLPITYAAPAQVAMFTGWSFFFTGVANAYLLAGDPHGNTIGLVSTDADWLPFPYNQALYLESAPEQFNLRGSLGKGQRHWALYVGKQGDFAANPVKEFYRWWFTRVVLPLDKVSNWQLTWDGMDRIEFPHAFFSKADMPAIRARMQAEPAISTLMNKLKPRIDTEVAAAYLYTGDAKYLDQLATTNNPTAYLDKFIDINLNESGYYTNSVYNMMQATDELLQRYIGMEFMAGERMTPEQRKTFLSKLAFTSYLMHDSFWCPPNYAYEPNKPDPYPGYVQGTPNQKHCYFAGVAMTACLLANHPHLPAWLQFALEENERVMPASVSPGGVHLESPFYSARDTMRFGPFWTALTRAGIDTPQSRAWIQREKMTYQYLGDMLTPPEPRMGGRRVYHPLGRSSSGVIDPTFLIGADPFGAGDPEHGKLMRWYWEQQGKPSPDNMGTTGGRDLSLTLLAISKLPAQAAATPPLHSRRWEGFGAIFRSQVGSGFESNVIFRHDPFAWNLYEANNGAVYFYGKGAPLLPRFGGYWMGQQGQPHLMSVPFGNRLLFADGMHEQDWMNGLGTMTAFASLGNLADYADGVTLNNSWRRSVLFAKDLDRDDPEYLLVRDDVLRADAPSALHWWVLSKAVQPDGLEKPGVIPTKGTDTAWLANMGKNWKAAPTLIGQSHHFEGQCGVDLDMFIAAPRAPKIVTDAVGTGPNQSYNANPKMYEYQQLVRIEQSAGQTHYLTLFVPRWPGSEAPTYRNLGDAGVAITWKNREDRLFIGADAASTYKDANVTFSGHAGFVRTGGSAPLRMMVQQGSISSNGVTLTSLTAAALIYDGKTMTVYGKDAVLKQSGKMKRVKVVRAA